MSRAGSGRALDGRPGYLVEIYGRPRRTADGRDAQEVAIRAAVDRVRAAGIDISYAGRVDIPADETTFHLFGSPTRDAVDEVMRRAGLTPNRIVEASAVALEPRSRPSAGQPSQGDPT